MMKVVTWKKEDREVFFKFAANFVRANDRAHANVLTLGPLVETFQNARVPTEQIARMRNKERRTLQNFDLWIGDIIRLIDALDEIKIKWSPEEFFEVARDHSPITASRFQLLAAQLNGFLNGHTEEIRDVLHQIGFALRKCTIKYGENDQEALDDILNSVTDHINTDDFTRFSLALQILHKVQDREEARQNS